MADGDGIGQQDPSDSASEFNSIAFVIAQALSGVSTMKLVVVRGVDASAKTVDVQPLVGQIDGGNNVTPEGTVYGVPYVMWQYGKSAVIADPAVGDKGLMICADRDISAVKGSKDVGPPGSLRQLDAADGVYLGGVLNSDPEQWVKFTDTGMELHDKSGNSLVSSSTGWVFTGPVTFNQTIDVKGAATLEGALQLGGSIESVTGGLYTSNIHTSGTITADNDVISGTISGKLHTHQYQRPTTGGTTPTSTGAPA